MGDIFSDLFDPTKPKPVLPNQAPVSTSAPTPTAPVTTPPASNSAAPTATPASPSDGGAAVFSSDTGTIQGILRSKAAEISASIAALHANTLIDESVQGAVGDTAKATLEATHNIERAASLPGGVDGKLARIISLFDSDFNAGKQKIIIDENALRAASIKATGDALKEKNNELPTLLGKISEVEVAAHTAQVQENTLATQQYEARIHAAELGIHMRADQRAQIEFNARSLTADQAAAALADANNGKGRWKGMQGFLQDRIISEQKAEADLGVANNALLKGNREEHYAALEAFVGDLPVDYVRSQLQAAQTAGKPSVTFQIGVDPKTKQPITQEIPISTVQAGIIKGMDLENRANAAVAADVTDKLNVVPRINTTINSASALASLDPRAGTVVTQTASIVNALQPKNPSNVRQISGILANGPETQLATIIKDYSAQLRTPEGKAGFERFGKTGSFDPVGATAFLGDTIGTPSMANTALYKTAFTSFNTALATALKAEHVMDTGTFDPKQPQDAQAMLAAALQKPDGKQAISRLATEILQDPSQTKGLANQIAAVVRPQAVNAVLQGLTKQKDANPIWNEVFHHPESWISTTPAGSPNAGKPFVDYKKLFEVLEKESVKTGGKVNFAQAFLTNMIGYAQNVDNTASSDPRYTVFDRALESAIYGNRPHQAILAGMIGTLQGYAAQVHAEMQGRIQKDVTGATQRQALQLTDGPDAISQIGPLDNVVSPSTVKDKNIHARLLEVPSATGTGLTAEQIKRLYGGGH